MALSNPFSIFLFISALVALFVAILTWRRRSAPGAKPLSLLLLAMFIWAGSNGLILESKDPWWQIFWFNILTFGAVMGTPAFWAFGIEFTERGHWLTLKNILLVSLIPVISVILAWTTDQHGLFYAARDFSAKLPNGNWNFAPGPFYWIHITYSYFVSALILLLIVHSFFKSSSIYRGQSAAILAGTLVPLIGNIIYNFFIGTGNGPIDPTPMLFTIMGVFYALGIFWFDLFDVNPIARYTLVENMQDGVIVVDSQNRIVDVNPSALRWLNWHGSSPVGKHVKKLLDIWYEQFADFPVELYIQTEVRNAERPETYFDLRVEPINDKYKSLAGRLIVFRDITRQKMAEKALLETHDRLRLHLREIEFLHEELREQTLRDPLTGLFNRRYLEETLEREISRAARDGISIGICMADIDQFKSLNDEHGHKAGDVVLKNLAEIFTSYSRAGDVVCRYGGEEFLILLPGADLDVTSRRAEDWRRAFEQSRIEFEGKVLSSTLSLGVAIFPEQGHTSDELLKLADHALYLSKRNGKNQVSVTPAWGRQE